MNDDFWKLKIRAFLHDPPDKALDIQKHKARAKDYLDLFGLEPLPKDALWPDWAASAADRIIDFARDIRVVFLREAALKHPLSGQDIDIGPLQTTLPSLDVTSVFANVRKVFEEIAQAYHSPKERYLSLWRRLPEMLGDKLPDIGLLWRHLPADTRIPDHSIWNHMDATAALAGATYNGDNGDHPAFLLLQIGPVRDFIATARRTQDLWAGSFLLSYLSWRAIEAVATKLGPDAILYPHLRRQPLCDHWLNGQGIPLDKLDPDRLLTPSLPNKFLALVPQNQGEALVKEAQEAVRQAWREVAEAVRQYLGKAMSQALAGWDAKWGEQVDAHLEVYWALLPWPQDPEASRNRHEALFGREGVQNFDALWELLEELAKDPNLVRCHPNLGDCYGLLHQEVTALLDGRKKARSFTHYEGDGREKCTLCGAWEQMGPPHLDRQRMRDFWKRLAEKLPTGSLKRGGSERLCAVCLTKRLAFDVYFKEKLASKDLPFPSTSNLATAGFKERVLNQMGARPGVSQAVRQYNEAMDRLYSVLESGLPRVDRSLPYLYKLAGEDPVKRRFIDFDGEWLFEESFTQRRIEEDYRVKEGTNLQEILGACRGALRELMQAVDDSPSRYYAVLRMDGDSMGQWLAGQHKKLPALGEVLHPAVSQRLKQTRTGSQLLDLKPRPIGPAVHAFISSALRDFSLTLVRHIVEEKHPGRVVYSGGDDLLALLPIEHALEASRELRAYYSGLLRKQGTSLEVDFGGQMAMIPLGGTLDRPDDLLMTMGTRATASIGIALAHHLQPLEFALESAREMEERAKDKYGRDAFAIATLKRSGEKVETGAHFRLSAEETALDTLKALLHLRDAFANGRLSSRFIYQLQEELLGLAGLSKEALVKELERLAQRHISQGKDLGAAREALQGLVEHLPLERVVDLGLVARFIASKGGER